LFMRRRHHKLQGFTLIELVLVMAIIAICAAIAAPRIAGFARGRMLPNAASQFASTARWCRVQALSDGVQYRLNVDFAGNTYWVTKDDGTGAYIQVTDELGQLISLPEGVYFGGTTIGSADDGFYITVEVGGRTDVGTIQLTNGQNNVDVTCETPTGTFRVMDPNTGARVQ